MKKHLITALLLLCGTNVALAQYSYPVDRNIDITTTAKAMVKPNKFYVRIVITDNLGAGKKGIEQVEKSTLVPTLKKMGVDIDKQLSFSDYDSNFNSKQKVVLSKSYQLVLNNPEQLTNIITALQKEGISDVNIMRAVYTNSSKAIDSLKVEAINMARHNAEVITSVTKDKIGDILFVRYYESNYNAESRQLLMSSKSMSDSYDEVNYEPISFKDIELSVTMQVVFQLTK